MLFSQLLLQTPPPQPATVPASPLFIRVRDGVIVRAAAPQDSTRAVRGRDANAIPLHVRPTGMHVRKERLLESEPVRVIVRSCFWV